MSIKETKHKENQHIYDSYPEIGDHICKQCGKHYHTEYKKLKTVKRKYRYTLYTSDFCSEKCRRSWVTRNITVPARSCKTQTLKCNECGKEETVGILGYRQVNFLCAEHRKEHQKRWYREHAKKRVIPRKKYKYSRAAGVDFFGEQKKLNFCRVYEIDPETLNISFNSHVSTELKEKYTAMYPIVIKPLLDVGIDFRNLGCALRRNLKKELYDKGRALVILNQNKNYKKFLTEGEVFSFIENVIYFYQYPYDTELGKFERRASYLNLISGHEALHSKNHFAALKNSGYKVGADLEKEYFRLKNLIKELKDVRGYSNLDFMSEFDLNGVSEVAQLFELFGLGDYYRNYSSQMGNYRYKVGKLQTWFGEDCRYVSSYEKKMIELLNSLRINYKAANGRKENAINYFDSQKGISRKGYPDFYLPDYGIYVETKGEHFLDKQNLRDRYRVIRREGKSLIVLGFETGRPNLLAQYFTPRDSRKITELLTLLEADVLTT